jgi:hypothetical protein
METKKTKKTNKTIKIIISTIILSAAIGMIAYGTYSGDFAKVKAKAVKICTECIGLG